MFVFCKPLAVIALFSASWMGIALNAQEPAKNDNIDQKILDELRGDYVLRAGIVDGNKMTADRIANVSLKITDKTITTYDGQREQRFGASYRILSEKRPWQVTLKSVKKISVGDSKTKEKVDESEGIFDLSEDGKRLKLAYSVDGGERPKDFKGGKQQNVFEFERLK